MRRNTLAGFYWWREGSLKPKGIVVVTGPAPDARGAVYIPMGYLWPRNWVLYPDCVIVRLGPVCHGDATPGRDSL